MIRVLVVDDSAVLRKQLEFILQSDPEVQVIGQAVNGEQAIRMAEKLAPDVITMDIRMPRMDGFDAISVIMEQHPVPIVVVTGSDVEKELEVTRKALRYGAVSVLTKPGPITSPDFRAQAARMVRQIKLMSSVKVVSRKSLRVAPPSPVVQQPKGPSHAEGVRTQAKIIAIGSSTGGPAALYKVIGGLPADLDVPVVVVQHISFGFVKGLAQWLDGGSQLAVMVPEHGERITAGKVYLAPDNHHMQVDRFGRIRLDESAARGGHRPSVTVLFESVAQAYGSSAVAAILTGMGADGAQGMLTLKRAGAQTVAQDEKSCVVFGMPREAIALGAVDHVVPLDSVAATLMSLKAS